jgi:hypothetical protein
MSRQRLAFRVLIELVSRYPADYAGVVSVVPARGRVPPDVVFTGLMGTTRGRQKRTAPQDTILFPGAAPGKPHVLLRSAAAQVPDLQRFRPSGRGFRMTAGARLRTGCAPQRLPRDEIVTE